MVKDSIVLSHPTRSINGTVFLPSSKSESNRLVIIQALAGENHKITNLSSARDTQTLLSILNGESMLWDVKDAGTTMRFLTALAAIKGLPVVISGTSRMHQRPIGILVDALVQLGANIEYIEQKGFPPLRINSFQYSGLKSIKMDGSVSSQFVSAICLVAPLLPFGLHIELTGDPSSIPYIDLTLESMSSSGIYAKRSGSLIKINTGEYKYDGSSVERDWSSAGYWFSIAMLSHTCQIFLPGLRHDSIQADSAILEISRKLKNVSLSTESAGITIEKKSNILSKISKDVFEFDFSNCPDLAQTVIVLFSALQIPFRFTGLKSLRIKETDRVKALQIELLKFGVQLVETSPGFFENQGTFGFQPELMVIDTYDDHRMAMAFASLALIRPICINNPGVVNKSYAEFWEHLKAVGFQIN